MSAEPTAAVDDVARPSRPIGSAPSREALSKLLRQLARRDLHRRGRPAPERHPPGLDAEIERGWYWRGHTKVKTKDGDVIRRSTTGRRLAAAVAA